MGSFESLDVLYLPSLNLSWPIPFVWASDLALLIQQKRIAQLKYQQDLTIPDFLQVLEKQQLSALLISERWHFSNKAELHGHHQGRKM